MTCAPAKPRLTISLPSLSDEELARLMKWTLKTGCGCKYLPLCNWLVEQLAAEMDRRTADDPELCEPEMPVLPDWTPKQAAEALAGITALSYGGLRPAEAKFIDGVMTSITALVIVMLHEYEDLEQAARSVVAKIQSDTGASDEEV